MMATVVQLLPIRRTFVIAVFIGLFAMAARNVLDPDVWWHLKTGAWIVQHEAAPHIDPFSYTRAGQPWTAHEWLFEVFIYGLFRLSGYAGLIVTFAAIVSAAFIPLYLRCQTNSVIAGAVTVWGALATAVVWGVRPQILSLLLFSLWLLILERSEKNPRLLWWTLPLTIFWVNVHAGFILGPVFVALFMAGELIETRWPPTECVRHRLLWLSLALFGNLVLTPLNPNGASIFKYPFETLRSSAMQSHISEWASPNFHSVDYRAFLFLLLAVFAAMVFSRRQVRPRDVLLLLVGTAAALTSVRMIPLFVFIAVPLLASAGLTSFTPSRGASQPTPVLAGPINAAFLLSLILLAAFHTSQVISHQSKAEAAVFPTAAVAYLQQHPPAGPIFNDYSWGGYLIFKLFPVMQVSIDGRADVYGDDLLHFMNAYYLQKNWQQALAAWKVTTVIVPPDCALASALREMPEWSLSYQDSVAAIFSKSLDSGILRGRSSSSASRDGGKTAATMVARGPLLECKKLHPLVRFAGYDVGYEGEPASPCNSRAHIKNTWKALSFFGG